MCNCSLGPECTYDPETGYPGSHAALFVHYYDWMKFLVSKSGFDSATVEDVTMSILTRFIANGKMEAYEANHVEARGGPKMLKFSHMLKGYVYLSLRNFYEKDQRRKKNEFAASAMVNSNEDEDFSLFEVVAEPTPDFAEELIQDLSFAGFEDNRLQAIEARIFSLRKQAEVRHDKASEKKADILDQVLTGCIELSERGKRVSPHALSTVCGLSVSNCRDALEEIRG